MGTRITIGDIDGEAANLLLVDRDKGFIADDALAAVLDFLASDKIKTYKRRKSFQNFTHKGLITL